ncbi:conserved exported hypothetical protein [Bradyrhizobium sp. ORS 375]|uniref:hypothetical protein n=1 Tax=Bradyrhizobium sp. (strain ORS 375) TaxID=566679 RepID=UPI0002405D9E|nr:hypothetical protein [Bradyrhizobium sp. ORS 375]CCD92986.1 conserved exported hypothetical protein [Bradyrhizobium sp. ORS 375]
MTRILGYAALTAVTLVAGTVAASAGEYGPGGYGYGGQVTSTYAYRDSYAWAPAPVYEEGYVAVAPGPSYGPGWGAGYNGTNHPTPSSTQGDVGPWGNNNGTRSGYYRW